MIESIEISLENYNKMAERLTYLEGKISDIQQWIPVAIGLPESHECVLLTIGNEYRPNEYSPYVEYGYYSVYDKCWHVDANKRKDIVAWMPLPRPYVINDDLERNCEESER